jgi:2-hydroxyacyl-CoA lyase 1
MLIIGKGVRWSEPTLELRQLVEALNLPFLTSPMGRGFIPDDHPLNFGAARSTMMGHADVIVIVGSRLNWV